MSSGSALSVEEAPPLGLPLRFFLSAPLFGLAAAVLLLVAGDQVFLSRWTPATLATVHLITVGFMLQVIAGALLQAVPVVAGAAPYQSRWGVGLVHGLLATGATALAGGFLASAPMLLRLGAGAAGAGGALALAAALSTLLRSRAGGVTIPALRLAVAGLAVALALGVVLALVRAGDLPVAWSVLSPAHVSWALGMGAFGLTAAMAYIVVPMFQMTPAYPRGLARWFHPALLGAVLLASLLAAATSMGAMGVVAPFLVVAVFAVATLDLQRRRRRAKVDTTLRLWQLGMMTVVPATASGVWASVASDSRLALLTGVLLLAGVAVPVMIGMLYKILPFIAWLHLRNQMARPPTMNTLLPESLITPQVAIHLGALACLAVAPWWPVFARPGGALLGLGFGWLLWAELRIAAKCRALPRGGSPAGK